MNPAKFLYPKVRENIRAYATWWQKLLPLPRITVAQRTTLFPKTRRPRPSQTWPGARRLRETGQREGREGGNRCFSYNALD